MNYISDIYADGMDIQTYYNRFGKTPAPLMNRIKTKTDSIYVGTLTQYGNQPMQILDDYMPCVKHFHMKCFEVTEDLVEYSINDAEIIGYLKRSNYSGAVSTEYEGSRWTLDDQPLQEKEQVIRHHLMLQRLIEEGADITEDSQNV